MRTVNPQPDLPGAVTRWTVTYKCSPDALRTMAFAAQGRNTFGTYEEAAKFLHAMLENNSEATLRSLYGDPRKLRVDQVQCWPGHFDPKGIYFD